MDRFDELSSELESSIAEEPTSENQADGLAKAVTDAARDYLEKAKGKKKGEKNPSDLTAEEISNNTEEEIEADGDPAEHPKASGGAYPDVKKYVKKAAECDDDDEDDDDEDDKPDFFKKKGKVKKAVTEDEEVDATEFMGELGEAVNYIGGRLENLAKSMNLLMKGQAIFGNIVADLADPRKDKLQETMAKALVFLVKENKELKKAVSLNVDLMKAVQKMPGLPVVAGMINPAGSSETADTVQKAQGPTASKADMDTLMKARLEGKITHAQWLQAKHTGDLSFLKG
jgi:hypothetical protein